MKGQVRGDLFSFTKLALIYGEGGNEERMFKTLKCFLVRKKGIKGFTKNLFISKINLILYSKFGKQKVHTF